MCRWQWIIVWTFVLCGSTIKSQSPTAPSTGQYAPLNRIFANPAFGSNTSYGWDASLVGLHIHGETDYGFLRTANLFNLSGRVSDATIIDARIDIPQENVDPLIIFDEDGGTKSGFARLDVMGPGVSFDLASGLRVGVASRMRVLGGIPNIPEGLGIYELNESYQTDIVDIDPIRGSAASWGEIALHLSRATETFSFGFNVKYLLPHQGAYADIKTDADYRFVDSTLFIDQPPIASFGLTNNIINEGAYSSQWNGNGLAIDLGITLPLGHGILGVAINDLGILSFTQNTEIYTADLLAGITEIDMRDYQELGDARDILDFFQQSQDIQPDIFSKISIGLPTRLSLSYDLPIHQSISVSAQLDQRLPLFSHSLSSYNSLIITPRIEDKWYAVYLPITIHEYSSPRIGLATRLGPLIIGSDHLGSLIGQNDFDGTDFYLQLSLYPFGKSDRSSRSKGAKGKDVFCPVFD